MSDGYNLYFTLNNAKRNLKDELVSEGVAKARKS